MQYRILLTNDEQKNWHDLGEGPFDSIEQACEFAQNEVGWPWIVVDETGRPLAYGSEAVSEVPGKMNRVMW